MFRLLKRNKAHRIVIPKTDENVAHNLYLRDYYLKDFKYISPEIVEAKKNRDKHFIPEDDQRSMFEKWLAEVMGGLRQFFYGGSLHGVKYIFEPTFSICEQAAWVVIMVISVAICAVNIIQLVSKWTSTPFVNVIDSVPSPVWAVPFPTVVLCPHLHVKLAYDNVSHMNELEQFFASLVCPRMMNQKFMRQRLDLEQITLLQDFLLKVSAIGGLLSLFLGFSIISVAELVYFVILRPAYIVLKEAYCRE